VALHPRVLELLAGPGGTRLAAIEEATRRRFFLVSAEGHIHTDHFTVLGEGKLVDLQPVSPLVEGSTVEVKLGEVGRYDATAAAGKIDGLDVLVADAAKLVGKKAAVTIGRVLDGQAFATLVVSGEVGEGPITFESEAEKPTRAPARRKSATATADAGESAVTDDDGDEDLFADGEPDPGQVVDLEDGREAGESVGEADAGELDADEAGADDLGADEVSADGVTAAKKRTRRGSRGGRRRRKPAAAGVATEGEADAATADEAPDDLIAPESAVVETAGTAETTGTAQTEAPGSASGTARAPRQRRTSRIHVPGDPAAAPVSPDVIQEAATEIAGDPVEVLELTIGADLEGDPEGPTTATDDGDGPPAVKRKTRRGSRGGRSRSKKPAVAGAEGVADADAGAEPDAKATEDAGAEAHGAVAASAIEVPELDTSAAGNGPAVVAVEPVAESAPRDEPGDTDESSDTDEPGDTDESSDAGYVPMSEWLGDFDRR